jgi:hypothetical protein
LQALLIGVIAQACTAGARIGAAAATGGVQLAG